jgi:mono/diheme cytochrome c family protein
MKTKRMSLVLLACASALAAAGCRTAPGRPAPGAEAERPDQVVDFPTLYKENCAACHGDRGQNGAALSLANPVYLAYAGAANLQRITANGVPGTLMPAFAKSKGGMLTDQQVEIIVKGMLQSWGKPVSGQPLPPFEPEPASSAAPSSGTGAPPTPVASADPKPAGDATQGQAIFTQFCARCHGADGNGTTAAGGERGSLLDPAYLALISDGGLRSLIVAGQPGQGMPDFRSDGARPMTDTEIGDAVAFLAQHRTATPGQIYKQQP